MLVFATTMAVLICQINGPGNTQQAQPTVDAFLRRLEAVAAWPADSLTGVYHNDEASCLNYVRKQRPAFVAVDAATYLSRRRRWALRPLAQLGDFEQQQFYVLAGAGGPRQVGQLEGKRVVSVAGLDRKFLSNVILGRGVAVDRLELKSVRRPLKAVRLLARKKVDAAIVDSRTFKHLAELPFAKALSEIGRSRKLPRLVLAAAGSVPRARRQAVRQAAAKLCLTAQNNLCRRFGASRFTVADAKQYRKLERLYARGLRLRK